MSALKDLIGSDIASMEQILANLLSPENVEMKTEIQNPLGFSGLAMFSEYLVRLGFTKSANLINRFLKTHFIYCVSKNRGSRNEVIEAFKNANISIERENELE